MGQKILITGQRWDDGDVPEAYKRYLTPDRWAEVMDEAKAVKEAQEALDEAEKALTEKLRQLGVVLSLTEIRPRVADVDDLNPEEIQDLRTIMVP